jgi:hypothetical protein
MTKLFASAGCSALLCAVSSVSADTILNPNFTSGFSSDYTAVTTPDRGGPGGAWVEGTYAIDTNPNNQHALWSSFTSPTGGNMLIVNGSPNAGARVWYETLGPGTYDFSALVANTYADSIAGLTLELDGNQVGSVFSAANPPGTWSTWNETFTIKNSEVLSIVDLNTALGGNDFALAQANVPDGGLTSAMMGFAFAGLGVARRIIKK